MQSAILAVTGNVVCWPKRDKAELAVTPRSPASHIGGLHPPYATCADEEGIGKSLDGSKQQARNPTFPPGKMTPPGWLKRNIVV
jgi:hypothetical protein